MTQPLSDRELEELLQEATPGPWMNTDYGGRIEIASQRFLVAEIDVSYDEYFDREKCEADARLIAAAPALAEEVLRLREVFCPICKHDCQSVWCYYDDPPTRCERCHAEEKR